MREHWAEIPGYEGKYSASSLGRLKSLPRKIKNNFTTDRTILVPGQVLKLRKRGRYLAWKNKSVHRMVALAFIPRVGGKICVNHKNGNRYDNRIENLEWCTYKENTAHWRKNAPPGFLDDLKRKIIKANSWKTGDKNHFYGRKHSVESRQLMSIAVKRLWADGKYPQKEQCKRGHFFSPDNIYRYRGYRYCLTCIKVSRKRAQLKYRKKIKTMGK